MRSRLLLEYDGTSFAGWARQEGARTVQESVERALAVVLRVAAVRLTVAGRTDAGVHAWGQVASYSGPPVAVRSLNALLPADVAVLSCSEAAPGFDARRDATSRAYCYRVLTREARSALEPGRALWWPHRVDAGGFGGVRVSSGRDARLHGVHADRDRARAVLAGRVRCVTGGGMLVIRTCCRSGSRRTRSCVT